MSRVLVIPDVHMKTEVVEHGLSLARKHFADKIIMLGDYFDEWYAIDDDYSKMVTYLKKLLRSNPTVFPLIGNHELSYMGYPCSGFRYSQRKMLWDFLIKNYRFALCYAIDGVLYTHAGVTRQWLKNNGLVTANDYRLKLHRGSGADIAESGISRLNQYPRTVESLAPLAQVGPARGGKTNPSPVWADLTELIADPAPFKQVVGHTPVKQIENIGRVWFCDTYSNYNQNNEYLLVQEGEPTIVTYGEGDEKYGR